jgi:hypothetical protein
LRTCPDTHKLRLASPDETTERDPIFTLHDHLHYTCRNKRCECVPTAHAARDAGPQILSCTTISGSSKLHRAWGNRVANPARCCTPMAPRGSENARWPPLSQYATQWPTDAPAGGASPVFTMPTPSRPTGGSVSWAQHPSHCDGNHARPTASSCDCHVVSCPRTVSVAWSAARCSHAASLIPEPACGGPLMLWPMPP